MKTLTWPHSSQNYYAMDSLHQQSTPTYFKMTKFIYSTDSVDPVITQNNMSLTPEYLRISKNVYTKIFFINIDEDYKYNDTTENRYGNDPFISFENPYTIEITTTLFDPSHDSYQGTEEYDSEYFDKSRVCFSIGQNVSGVGGNIFTVGTDSTHTNKKKPVIGVTTKDGCIKSLPTVDALSIEDSNEYTFRLVYNPSGINEGKLLLFMRKESSSNLDNAYVLQSTAYGLSTTYNYNITKPRLYLYSSGWTNETGWDQTFDYTFASFDENSEPIKVSDGVSYPIEYTLSQLEGIAYEEPSFDFNIEEVPKYDDQSVQTEELYISSESGNLVIYTQ